MALTMGYAEKIEEIRQSVSAKSYIDDESWDMVEKAFRGVVVGVNAAVAADYYGNVGKVESGSKGNLNSYADFNKVVSDIGKRTDLTDWQKVKELQNLFENSNYKTDINVPSDIQYVKGVDAKGNIIYDWPSKLCFDENTIKPITRSDGLPDTWDRYGYMGGLQFCGCSINRKIFI